MLKFLVAAISVACTLPVAAQSVYRCTDAAGKVQLRDRPCDAAAVDGVRLQVRPNTMDNAGEREYLLKLENERLRRELDEQRAATAKSEAKAATRERRRVTVSNCHDAGFGRTQCISR